MIIDFHAHVYPEKIAEKATKAISDFYNAPMVYHGKVEELLESGSKIGVVKYIVHSTATNSGCSSFKSIIKSFIDSTCIGFVAVE